MESEAEFYFDCAELIDVEAALTLARDCQNLLTLVTHRATNIARIAGRCRTMQLPSPPNAEASTRAVTVETWADLIIHLSTSEQAGVEYTRFEPITRVDEVTPSALSKWFGEQNKFRDIVELTLSSRYLKSYSTTEFINLTQGLEALHRRLSKGKYCSEEDFEEIRKQLVSAIPRDIGEGLTSKLEDLYKYANEYSLRKRLRDLISSLPDEMQNAISKDQKAFVENIVKTRNYLTHLDHNEKAQSLLRSDDLSELVRANYSLRAIVTLHLLSIIGVENQAVLRRVVRYIF